MDRKKITEANRLAWNQVTPVHQKARKVDLKKEFETPGYSTLDDLITEKLKSVGLDGKDVAQLGCNNGRETISLVNLGARSAVGFDISDEAIAEANELAAIAKVDCRFVRTDVYDIGEEYHNRFDLIFISVGALSWLPDLDHFFVIVSSLLKPGGSLVMYEMHPILYIFGTEDDEGYDPNEPDKIMYSYFRTEPWVDETGIDYIGGSRYESAPSYSYTQKISDIINAVLRSGIILDEFLEFPHDISEPFRDLEKVGNMPLCFILRGTKVSR